MHPDYTGLSDNEYQKSFSSERQQQQPFDSRSMSAFSDQFDDNKKTSIKNRKKKKSKKNRMTVSTFHPAPINPQAQWIYNMAAWQNPSYMFSQTPMQYIANQPLLYAPVATDFTGFDNLTNSEYLMSVDREIDNRFGDVTNADYRLRCSNINSTKEKIQFIHVDCKRRFVSIKQPEWLNALDENAGYPVDSTLLDHLQCHLGPFQRRTSSIQLASSFCKKKFATAGPRQPLWKLMHNLITHNKPRRSNFDNWFLLESIFEKNLSSQPIIPCPKQNHNSSSFQDNEILELLVSSESSVAAMNKASDENHWAAALLISMMDAEPEEQKEIMLKYVNSLDPKLPLTSYYKLRLGQLSPALQLSECVCDGKWKDHLMILLALQGIIPPNLFKQSLSDLCGTLLHSNEYIAYYCCRLLSDPVFHPVGPGSHRVILLGLDNARHPCEKFSQIEELLHNPDVFDCFQLTELYEFSRNLILPTLLPFKIATAKLLLEYKQFVKSWRYCELVAHQLLQYWSRPYSFDVEKDALETLIEVCYRLKPMISGIHCPDLSWLPNLVSLFNLVSSAGINRFKSYTGYDETQINPYESLYRNSRPASRMKSPMLITRPSVFQQKSLLLHMDNDSDIYSSIANGDSVQSRPKSITGEPIAQYNYRQPTVESDNNCSPIAESFNCLQITESPTNKESDIMQTAVTTASQPPVKEMANAVKPQVDEIANPSKVPNLSSSSNGSGIINRMFGSIFPKAVNPVHLESDGNSKFEYDEQKKAWVDRNAPETAEQNQCLQPPPTLMSSTSLPTCSNGSVHSGGASHSLAGSKFGYVNAWQQSNSSEDTNDSQTSHESSLFNNSLDLLNPHVVKSSTDNTHSSFFIPEQ